MTIMPRTIAAAERMWTQPELLDKEKAAERFPYIRCEFNRRGIAASPAFGKGRSMDFERLGVCDELIREISDEYWESACDSGVIL